MMCFSMKPKKHEAMPDGKWEVKEKKNFGPKPILFGLNPNFNFR